MMMRQTSKAHNDIPRGRLVSSLLLLGARLRLARPPAVPRSQDCVLHQAGLICVQTVSRRPGDHGILRSSRSQAKFVRGHH
jgi:hypothetical protein